jgi:catechol 2,3-dioxygenase-like lactoylglutathione lyase family enzyme
VTSRIKNLTFDCADPRALAVFWANVLGYDPAGIEGDQDEGLTYVGDASGDRPGLLFIIVPEGKTAKNRIHFDLTPATTRDEEVQRLLALGATVADDRRLPDGKGWVVMHDPEGNELCVERSEAERAHPA